MNKLPQEIDNGETSFGYRSWNSKFMKKMDNEPFLLFILCLITIVHGTVNGYIYLAILNFERLYGFNNIFSSLLIVIYEITIVAIFLLMIKINKKYNTFSLLGVGMLLLDIGCLLFSFPRVFDNSGNTNSDIEYCTKNPKTKVDYPEFKYISLCIFISAQILNGIASTTLYTTTYDLINENVKTSSSKVYINLTSSCAIISPALGYISGGLIQKVLTDHMGLLDIHNYINSKSYQEWWIPLIFASFVFVLIAFILFAFPNHLSGHLDIINNKTVKSLSSFNSVSLVTDANFKCSSVLIGAIMGIITDNILFKNISIDNSVNIKLFLAIISVPLSLFFLINCKFVPMAGVNHQYINSDSINFKLLNVCNMDCHCSNLPFYPICHKSPFSDFPDISYASHCWAGCSVTATFAFGSLLDHVCLKKSKNMTCKYYDHDKLSNIIITVCMIIRSLYVFINYFTKKVMKNDEQ
ncbi:hypothetical protein A3Q56_01778 [Intoshia linei]|uniref:Uncharacterized protein n=1 Tax=Intoshia linei TaxID=1819745 RepID=A0A177B8I5_9BILA|nr:hypothetical protein A3Q56_01778 [Intoshia linei]